MNSPSDEERGRMSIDAAAAQRFLADQFDPQVRDVEPAGAGAWSRAFSFRRGADELIVRFGSHGDDFAKDRRAYRYHAPGLPVPEVLAVGPAFGGFYAISRRMWGTPLEHVEPAVWALATQPCRPAQRVRATYRSRPPGLQRLRRRLADA